MPGRLAKADRVAEPKGEANRSSREERAAATSMQLCFEHHFSFPPSSSISPGLLYHFLKIKRRQGTGRCEPKLLSGDRPRRDIFQDIQSQNSQGDGFHSLSISKTELDLGPLKVVNLFTQELSNLSQSNLPITNSALVVASSQSHCHFGFISY